MGRAGRSLTPSRTTPPVWALALAPAAFLLVFFAWPVSQVLREALGPDGWSVLSLPSTRRVLWFTTWQAVLSTLLTLLLGMPMAYVLHRVAVPGRRVWLALVTVPFVLPTVVVGTAFRTVLPHDTPAVVAILLAHVFFNVAVVARVVGGTWAHLDPRYEHAAASLGAGPARVFATVTWPLLRPAVAAASALVFLFTFTSFGVVVVLGTPRTTTIEVEIYRRTTQLLDLPGAAVLAVLQLAVLVAVLVVSGRLQARLAVRQRMRVEEVLTPVRGWGLGALVAFVAVEGVLLALPLLSLIRRSLRVGDGWGLAWWRRLFAAPERTGDLVVADALRLSVTYALFTVVIAVVLGGLAACAVAYAGRGATWLDSGLMLPLSTSAVTIGFGLFLAYRTPPFDFRGAAWLVPVGHSLVAIPLVVRTTLPVLRAVDPRLRDVAATLGARPTRAWWTVDGHLLRRSLSVAAGLAAAVSLGEFGATAFLSRTGSPTLPVAVVRLLSRPGEANVGTAAAAATLLMVVTAVVVLATDRWRVHGSGGL